jgi:hypothetical protein
MTNFLDLPQEVKDMIYVYALGAAPLPLEAEVSLSPHDLSYCGSIRCMSLSWSSAKGNSHASHEEIELMLPLTIPTIAAFGLVNRQVHSEMLQTLNRIKRRRCGPLEYELRCVVDIDIDLLETRLLLQWTKLPTLRFFVHRIRIVVELSQRASAMVRTDKSHNFFTFVAKRLHYSARHIIQRIIKHGPPMQGKLRLPFIVDNMVVKLEMPKTEREQQVDTLLDKFAGWCDWVYWARSTKGRRGKVRCLTWELCGRQKGKDTDDLKLPAWTGTRIVFDD